MQHHLALAGRSDTLFSDDAVALIHDTSRGLPRLINNLAVAALIAMFVEEDDRGRVRRRAAVTESSANDRACAVTARPADA